MKKNGFIVFIMLLITISAYPQDTVKVIQSDVKLHINTRNAKIDTCFDYYFGTGLKVIIKESVTVDLKGSYERDNGIIYLAHQEKASCQYGQAGYIYDTEKDIKLFYASVYYPFLKIFKVGYDFSVDQDINHSIYLSVKWKFVSAQVVFLEDIRRIKYLVNPTIKKWKRLSLKANIEGFYVPEKFKWTNGLTLNYKIK